MPGDVKAEGELRGTRCVGTGPVDEEVKAFHLEDTAKAQMKDLLFYFLKLSYLK